MQAHLLQRKDVHSFSAPFLQKCGNVLACLPERRCIRLIQDKLGMI